MYKAWLDATQDQALVEGPLKAWLGQHQTLLEAQFVYYAWVENGFEFEVIRKNVLKQNILSV